MSRRDALRTGRDLLTGTLLLLAAGGAYYQQRATQQDRRAHQPPGRLVTVDGRRVHLHARGSGGPTVVLVTGLGDNSQSWGALPARLAGQTRVCLYDRPGYGWSDPAPGPLSAAAIAANLRAALQAAGEQGPFVLAGHSFGGIYIRAFARQFPADVAGLLLIDSSHESHSLRLPPAVLGDWRQTAQLQAMRLLAPLGIPRLFRLHEAPIAGRPLDATAQARMLALHNQAHFSRTVLHELATAARDSARPEGPAGLGDLPLIVLTRGVDFKPEDLPHVPAQVLDQANQVWQQLQAELAALSTRGKQIVATQSGHYIHYSEPDLVADAVLELVAAANGQAD